MLVPQLLDSPSVAAGYPTVVGASTSAVVVSPTGLGASTSVVAVGPFASPSAIVFRYVDYGMETPMDRNPGENGDLG